MKLKSHIVATITISSIVYFIFNSFSAFISSLIGGILIDLDHLLDYCIHRGINFNVKNFFIWCYNNQWNTLIVFFHSFELILIFWLAIFIFNLGIFWIGLAIGISQHIILDVLGNRDMINLHSYFFIFRLTKGFKKEYILREDYLDERC